MLQFERRVAEERTSIECFDSQGTVWSNRVTVY